MRLVSIWQQEFANSKSNVISGTNKQITMMNQSLNKGLHYLLSRSFSLSFSGLVEPEWSQLTGKSVISSYS
jgi:hypothetical protein